MNKANLLAGGKLAHTGSHIHTLYGQPCQTLYLTLYAGKHARKKTMEDTAAGPR